ncbi:hypothetical protein J3R30DRAFT_3406103 [Lentinula aciculospora]|uniref:Uncharacterized protein n=1 Tax=Lentinula aciculospora TaxID=153920 RepID=A0A9W9A6V4_9AGAR|nr:hypothetical protein J3R30DRAFT_3406103 [Lentinula aciculospora]
MKKVEGMSVRKTRAWWNATKNNMIDAIGRLLQQPTIVNFAMQHGVLLSDYRHGNVHVIFNGVGTVKEAKFIDYGFPRMIAIERKTTRETIVGFYFGSSMTFSVAQEQYVKRHWDQI